MPDHPVHSLFDDPMEQRDYDTHQEQQHEWDTALEARDRAITRAGSHANEAWMSQALDAIRMVARTQPALTSEDIHELVVAGTHEPRALGAVFRAAQREGWITAGPYVKSRRRESHCRPVRQWISQLYVEA